MSDKQKVDVIDKTFALAKEIKDNQFRLMERSIYYNAFNAHVFKYDLQEEAYAEMDIEKEVAQMKNKKK